MLGVISIFMGLSIIANPVYYDIQWQMTNDLSSVKWPLGLGFLAFGFVCLWLVITKKLGNSCYWICPKCEDVFNLNSNGEKKYCDNCGTPLEKLEGYYKK